MTTIITNPRRRLMDLNKSFTRQRNIKFSEIKWDITPFSFKTPFAIQSIQTALVGSIEVFKQVIRYKNGSSNTIFFMGRNTSEFFETEEQLLNNVRICQIGAKNGSV